MDNTNQQADSINFTSQAYCAKKLSRCQLQNYHRSGYISDIEVLSKAELHYFLHHLMLTCDQLGGNISRFDGAHQVFPWAWQLSSHPAIINVIRQLLGENILLKSTRFFYKHPQSADFVGWHQDGFTEQEGSADVPTIWLGLTPSCAQNGCLQLIPGSHKKGLLPHPKIPHANNLTYDGTTAQTIIKNAINIEMPAGFMSVHQPLMVHGSQANLTSTPRIGFSASYATAALQKSISPVARIAGNARLSPALKLISEPKACSIREAVANYQLHLGHSIRRMEETQDTFPL
ncbi:phytanoyl-CoA dioxygenase family protein [Thalassomonas haliotis]|uniref:Phytanoyl-CoA dioxygenase family protein n=1 Tax=Thalassomonas haliotis TaxID=485448 RepID=A0ABY7VMA0_9GAMM|nr:phytanoyl-CoA dioxygenase family protein [Thalassomonas haliotis]WDE14302.1 phytanoyl-CoA dioxygenase family protein [Thalassomonas haliotis]